MDAIEFTKTHIHELKQRLDHAKDQNDPVNYGKSDEEIITMFLKDQGHNFGVVNSKDIEALLN